VRYTFHRDSLSERGSLGYLTGALLSPLEPLCETSLAAVVVVCLISSLPLCKYILPSVYLRSEGKPKFFPPTVPAGLLDLGLLSQPMIETCCVIGWPHTHRWLRSWKTASRALVYVRNRTPRCVSRSHNKTTRRLGRCSVSSRSA